MLSSSHQRHWLQNVLNLHIVTLLFLFLEHNSYQTNAVQQQQQSSLCRYRDVTIDLSAAQVDWHLCHRQGLETTYGFNGSYISTLLYTEPFVSSFQFYKKHCFQATHVPGTILTNMVQSNNTKHFFPHIKRNGNDKDVLFMDDNLQHVPDISTTGKDFYTYYWITSFHLSDLLSNVSTSQNSNNNNNNKKVKEKSTNSNNNVTLLDNCDIRFKIRSLNYRGTVFSNGIEIQPENPIIPRQSQRDKRNDAKPPPLGSAVGMFHQWTYLLHQGSRTTPKNVLSSSKTITIAILVEPPDYPGNVTGQQGGDHNIAKNAAIQQSTAGWDWIRGTPDRNTGLWDQLSLGIVDSSIEIHNIHVQTLSNITTRHPSNVDIGISVDILYDCSHLKYSMMSFGRCSHTNHSSDSKKAKDDRTFSIVVSVSETSPQLTMSFQFSLTDLKKKKKPLGTLHKCQTTLRLPPVKMIKPKTWWPHNYGTPHLYNLTIQLQSPTNDCDSNHPEHHDYERTFNDANNTINNSKNQVIIHSEKMTRFGIRTISSHVDTTVTNGRIFVCNGQKIFLQGGNWVGTDQFHRFSTSTTRYQNEIMLHKAMGLNVIRVWGGSITERPEFYHATDQEGILVIQEFWMTGDNNGRWAGSYSYPLDHNVYLSCVQDVIVMLRNHPSLMLWVGGNELYPQGLSPSYDIANAIQSFVTKLDPGRCYVASSMSNYTNYDPSFALAPKDGPYGFLSPFRFYQRNPGLKFWNGTLANHLKIGFQPETGSSSTPEYREIHLFLSKPHAEEFPTKHDQKVPSMFQYHNYLSYTDDMGWDHIYDAYGPPWNMSEYCFRAQLAQYNQFKGLMEGFQRYMWTYYTAVLFWKTQSPWPSFRGYTYSWWLEPTGGFYGIRAALEGGQPLHVQLGNWTRETYISIINRSPEIFNDHDKDEVTFSLAAQWWDLNGTLITSQVHKIDGYKILPNSVYTLHMKEFMFPAHATLGISYLRLVLDSPNDPSVCLRGKYNHDNYMSPYGCSFNDYYLSDPENHQNFTGLSEWRLNSTRLLRLDVKCLNYGTKNSDVIIQVTNPHKVLALQARVRLDDSQTNYFYSNQYISLLPFETRNLTIQEMFFDASKHTNRYSKRMLVLIDGLNIRSEKHFCGTMFPGGAKQSERVSRK